jgi:hypothetical protein
MTIVLGIMFFISSVTPLPETVILKVTTPLNSFAEAIKEEKRKMVNNNQLNDRFFLMI